MLGIWYDSRILSVCTIPVKYDLIAIKAHMAIVSVLEVSRTIEMMNRCKSFLC